MSNTLETNLVEAQRLADNDVKELLIIAQDSTSYGSDLKPKSSLHELLDLLDKINNIEWIICIMLIHLIYIKKLLKDFLT